MQAFIVSALINALLAVLDNVTVKRVLDKMLDVIEDAVLNSETKVDDAIVLSLCNKIRAELDVPDED